MPINYYCDVEVQSNVLTTDVSNSRVGINEGSPTATLQVNGNIRTGASSGSTYLNLADDELEFWNSGSERATLNVYPNNSSGSLFITGANGQTVYFGAPASWTTNISVQGQATLSTINNAASDTDKFLVSDGGNIKYRTGSQVLSDIGGAPSTGGNYLPLSGGTLTGDLYIPEYLYHAGDTNTYLRFQSDSVQLHSGGWKVFGNTTLKYGALYGDNSLRVYATQAGGYINGTLTVDTINNATSDTDKFLVSDGDEIKYRTGAEVLSDIGAGTGTVTGTGASGEVAFFTSTSAIDSDNKFNWDNTNKYLGIFTTSPSAQLVLANNNDDEKLILEGASGGKPSMTIYSGTQLMVTLQASGTSAGVLKTTKGALLLQSNSGYGLVVQDNSGNTVVEQSLKVNKNLTLPSIQNNSGEFLTIQSGLVGFRTPANVVSDLGLDKTQTILFSNFSDDTSSTSSLRIPFNTLTDTTSNQYYNTFDCPSDGTIKRIRMQNTKGTLSTGFTTIFDIWVNSTGTPTQSSGSLTASNSEIEYDPDLSFNKGDKVMIAYRKSAGSKYWRGVSASIVIEFDTVT